MEQGSYKRSMSQLQHITMFISTYMQSVMRNAQVGRAQSCQDAREISQPQRYGVGFINISWHKASMLSCESDIGAFKFGVKYNIQKTSIIYLVPTPWEIDQ